MMEIIPTTQPNQPKLVRYLLEVSCLRRTSSAFFSDKFGSPEAVTPWGVTATEEPELSRLLGRIMASRRLLLQSSVVHPGGVECLQYPARLLQCRRTARLLPYCCMLASRWLWWM